MKKAKFLFLTVLMLLGFVGVRAQTPATPVAIGLNYGIPQYSGDMGNGFFDLKQQFTSFGGLTFGLNLNNHWDFRLDGNYGNVAYMRNEANKLLTHFFQMGFNFKYNLFEVGKTKLNPYLFGGLGFMIFERPLGFRNWDFEMPSGGIGLTYYYNEDLSLYVQEKLIYTNFDEVDGIRQGLNDMFLLHTFGVMFNLGKADRDGDGIADRFDQCPDQYGPAEYHGCPDSDGDGVIDKEDDCPQTPGLAELNGCPDKDGDGIIDSKDDCPDQKGPAKFNGCPDSDGDGIIDKNDDCPNQKGLAKFNGCPDTDGDGIKDSEDKCPTVAGVPENHGCPKIEEKAKKVFKEALHGIKFATNSDKILPRSYPILDNVVDIMKRHPEYKLMIIGHTDSQGDDAYNMELSKRRAEAVRQYLIKKGIDPSRLIAIGKGETEPIADNSTPEGRRLNRRVEFKIIFE